MKLFYSILFTCYMVFRPLIPLAEYAVNYDYIVNSLCVNKSKPELHCNGKCYLGKELAKANSDSESTPFNKKKIQGRKFSISIFFLILHRWPLLKKILFFIGTFIYKTDYSFLFLKHIFKPPVF